MVIFVHILLDVQVCDIYYKRLIAYIGCIMHLSINIGLLVSPISK